MVGNRYTNERMITETTPPRDPWRTVWKIATGDYSLTVLLVAIAAGLVIAAWLPQMPSSGPAAYSQWLSKTQARFGDATSVLQTLGLFTVTRSPGFRLLVALLAGCLVLRLLEIADRLWRYRKMEAPAGRWQTLGNGNQSDVTDVTDVIDDIRHLRYRVLRDPPLVQADRWPWADLFVLLYHGGGLLFLIGLLITHTWGWRVEGLIVQRGQRITLPYADNWVALDDDLKLTHSPTIVTVLEERGPGVQASAVNSAGDHLPLQQTTEADPVTRLTLALTEDQYFAIPEANMIIRLSPQPGDAADGNAPVLVQVYQSPAGRLITETAIEGDAELKVDDVTLQLISIPYARLTAVSNPGRWPTILSIPLLVVGLLGNTVWPARRFWLRDQDGTIEGLGHLPPTLTGEQDA